MPGGSLYPAEQTTAAALKAGGLASSYIDRSGPFDQPGYVYIFYALFFVMLALLFFVIRSRLREARTSEKRD